MLTFTPDGQALLVANEGQPAEDYSVDPEGSVSLPEGVRNFGPQTVSSTVAQNVEPEYIAVAGDSASAWVSLQENSPCRWWTSLRRRSPRSCRWARGTTRCRRGTTFIVTASEGDARDYEGFAERRGSPTSYSTPAPSPTPPNSRRTPSSAA